MIHVPLLQAASSAGAADARRRTLRRCVPLAVRVTTPHPHSAASLLDARVRLDVGPHPYLAAALEALGARRGANRWSLPLAVLDVALGLLPPGCLLVDGARPDATWFAAHGLTYRRRTGPERLVRVHVSVTARSAVVVLEHEPLSLQLALDDAEGWLANSELPAFDASDGALVALRALAADAVVARPVPGSPNLARLVDARRSEQVLAAVDALGALAEHDARRPVACDPFVADLAHAATARPVADATLRPAQASAVGTYLASRWGTVCVLPPGAGKTVVAAASLERAPGAALVLAPPALLGQWAAELARFAPSRRVTLVGSRTAVAPAVIAHDEVVLASDAAAVKLVDGAFTLAHLVVDEAAHLARSSKRTTALWQLRRRAARVLLLTGTPASAQGVVALGELVSFTLNERGLFDGAPLDDDWAARVGPLVVGYGSTDDIPGATRRLVLLEPSPAETELIRAAGERLAAARASLAAAEASNSSDRHALRAAAMAAFGRARAAATDAAAVTGELAALAASVQVASKRAALVELCADGAATVVCCDSATAAAAAAAHLAAAGVAVGLLSSSTPRQRQPELAAALGAALQVLVVARVGQLGWNLQAAKRVVHYDVPLTHADARQREGRARRIGGGDVDVVCLALAGAVDADAAAAWVRTGVDAAGL